MTARLSFESRLYRTALYLYPPRFRHEFADEMAQDFDDASGEALVKDGGLALFRARIYADLFKTITLQWIETGLPAIGLTSALIPLLTVALLAGLTPHAAFVDVPAGREDADLLTLLFLVVVVLLIVATTVFFTVWFAHPWVRRRER